jgi:Universal stress protein family
MARAGVDIDLSVLPGCLASAAWHPRAVHREQRDGDVTGGNTMGDVVFAVLNHPGDVEALLEAGARLLEIGGGGSLTALAVRIPPEATILPSEEVLTAPRAAAIRAEQENWAGQLRELFDAWASRANRSSIRAEWLDLEGDIADIVADRGRRADLVVVAQALDQDSRRARDSLHAALFAGDSPVLIVPSNFTKPFGRVAAIAWKDDERAVKAVRASIPMLNQASRVVVLCADTPAETPAILREHGIAAEPYGVPDGDGSTGERLLSAAHHVGADLLVMGAFAHGAWREAMFGGVTRTMLAGADLPLLMCH